MAAKMAAKGVTPVHQLTPGQIARHQPVPDLLLFDI